MIAAAVLAVMLMLLLLLQFGDDAIAANNRVGTVHVLF